MRNPVRFKNLRSRFLPFFVLGGLALWLARPGELAFAAGTLLVGCGAGLRSWGAGHLVKNDRLTVSGPYAHLRHPLYLGSLLIALGFALIAGGVYGLLLIAIFVPWFFLAYFPRKDRVECERLEARYGDAYRRYRDAVPALLPALERWVPADETREVANSGESWSSARYSDNNELGTLIAVVVGLLAFGARVQYGS